ncbi:MAG TPA: flagellar hook-basal body complex protein FliE [Solirubrobacteraceae bacterium]|jgi:flagellar hook-basal body complex protein FliE
MTVLPIGAVGGEWSVSHIGKLSTSEAGGGSALGSGGASGLEGLSPTEGTGGAQGTGGVEGAEATGTSGEGGFGSELSNAISSLEQTQNNASNASQALATGTVSDPESAVVTVEEAQLAMQLASQIRTKATEAAQQIFQTQV